MAWQPSASASARARRRSSNAAERYVELALRLAKHTPQLVFGYSGPHQPAARIEAEEPRSPVELAREAERLSTELEARMLSNDVAANMALMRHNQGADEDELAAYAERWTLLPPERIRKLISWVCTQPFRGYVVTYPAGLRLARAFVVGDRARFKRLLTEQLVPDDLRVS